jgi:hypothetical protein
MQVPSKLEDWSLEVVQDLIKNGVSENQDFDFKSARVLLPGEGVATLSKATCAFANGRGGFIVIGVTDGPKRSIEGVVVDTELAKRFNDKIKVYPRPNFPAPLVIPAKDGKAVVVVHVPSSSDGPHASMVDGRPEFFVRTHSGAEPMNWVGIRDAMVRADERRRQADILLNQFRQHYLTAYHHRHGYLEKDDFPHAETFDLTLTHLAIADLHPWLAKDTHAMQSVSDLVSRMNAMNGMISAMIADVAVRPTRLPAWRSKLSASMLTVRDQLIHAEIGVRRAMGMPEANHQQVYPQF